MAKDPAFLFNTVEFMAQTASMSSKEVGKYIRLLCLQHQLGRITPLIITRVMKGKLSARVRNMFAVDADGCLYSEWLEEEMRRRKRYGRGGAVHKQWRLQVLKRDGRRCVECGATRYLQAHHVIPWASTSDGDPLRYDPDNGITLCRCCHNSVHGRKCKHGVD